MAWFFLIVTARNLVKSVREEMGVAGGVSAPCLALGRAHERRRERLLRPGAA
jgi:hypothetical protein